MTKTNSNFSSQEAHFGINLKSLIFSTIIFFSLHFGHFLIRLRGSSPETDAGRKIAFGSMSPSLY